MNSGFRLFNSASKHLVCFVDSSVFFPPKLQVKTFVALIRRKVLATLANLVFSLAYSVVLIGLSRLCQDLGALLEGFFMNFDNFDD